MKKHLIFAIFLVLTLCISFTAYAHAGSTDEFGGHINWDTGEYHYHHGYPAHSHDGGYCPYDFVDNADHSNNGYSSNNNYDYDYGNREPFLPDEQYPLVSPSPYRKKQESSFTNDINTSYKDKGETDFSYLLFIPVVIFMWYKHHKKKVAERKKCEEEKQHYTELYGNKDILDIINAPPTAFIDSEGYPHQAVENDDIFVVYVAPKQPRVFHRNRRCSKNLVKKNFIDIDYYHNGRKKLAPCKKCKPTIPDTKWYDEYQKIKAIKDKYKID